MPLTSAAASDPPAPAGPAPSLPSAPDPTYVTNGPVHAIARTADTIYIGGRFDRVGPRTGPGVEVGLDGVRTPGLPEIAGTGPTSTFGAGGVVNSVVPDGTGGWYVAGLFSHVGGVPRSNLAHIRADRSVDPAFAPAPNEMVETIVLSGTTLYAAGPFTSVSGTPRNRLAAISTLTGAVTSFNPDADGPISALQLSPDGTTLYVGGRFTRVGGLPRLAIAALRTANGTAVPTFNPNATGTSGNGVVEALALSGSTLYVGGSFSSVGGQPKTNLAALTVGGPLDGLAIAAFDPQPSRSGCAACGSVATLTAYGSTVFVGGMFDTIGGQPRSYLAALNGADGSATAFNPSPNGNVRDLAVAGSTLYVGGTFRSIAGAPSIGGQPRNYTAVLNIADGTATAFDPDTNGMVQTVAVSGSAVFLGGFFSSVGGVVRDGLAALSAVDGTVLPFAPSLAGVNGGTPVVYTIALAGSTAYIGGFFGSVGGQPRSSLAAVDAVAGTVLPWNPSAGHNGSAGVVDVVAVADDDVYVGGAYTRLGGQVRNALGSVDAVTGAVTDWAPDPNSEVAALVVADDVVYVGGYFTTIGGETRNKVAAIGRTTGSPTPWHPDLTALGNVLAIAVSGPNVYLGGNFTSVHGVARHNLAAVSASDATPTAFDPAPDDPNTGGGVSALAVHSDVVYAAGFFTQAGGQPRSLLAALRASDGSATGFAPNPSPGYGAYALALGPDGSLAAGGSFPTVEAAYQQGIAVFSPTTAAEPVVPEARPWHLLLASVVMFVIAMVWRRVADRSHRAA